MTSEPKSKEFKFDLNAKRTRINDAELIAALQSVTEALGGGYFTSPQYRCFPRPTSPFGDHNGKIRFLEKSVGPHRHQRRAKTLLLA